MLQLGVGSGLRFIKHRAHTRGAAEQFTLQLPQKGCDGQLQLIPAQDSGGISGGHQEHLFNHTVTQHTCHVVNKLQPTPVQSLPPPTPQPPIQQQPICHAAHATAIALT